MLSIEYFSVIKMIEELFDKKKYSVEKSIENSNIIVNFIRKNNVEFNYKIKIYSNNNIEITIPIKNSNYKYKTNVYDINSVYNYLYFHIVENKK